MRILMAAIILGGTLCGAAMAQTKPIGGADAAWMKSCGVRQDDIDVVPKLNDVAEFKLNKALRKRECDGLRPFMASRDFVRLFTPPPSKAPMPPKGFDNDYLTQAESDRINEIEKAILDRLLNN